MTTITVYWLKACRISGFKETIHAVMPREIHAEPSKQRNVLLFMTLPSGSTAALFCFHFTRRQCLDLFVLEGSPGNVSYTRSPTVEENVFFCGKPRK